MKKVCFSESERGEKIKICNCLNDREEADKIANAIRDKVRQTGEKWEEVAVLYRTNNQSAVVEQALARRGIPYRIYKGSSFYDHKEIKDMLAYIRLIINPKDDEAFKRIINYPLRGIGEATVQRIAQLAAGQGSSMWEAVDLLVKESETLNDAMQKTIARKVKEFVELIRSLGEALQTKGLYDFGLEVASRSGILAQYKVDNSPEATSAIDNIEELLNSMQLFNEQCEAEIRAGEREESQKPTVEEWLQSLMLLTDMDEKEEGESDKVTLMTVHSAKGLEYKYVYIVGCEENLFPSQRAMESPDGLEEERRLFYVALTRAKSEAMLSCCEMRFKWGTMEFSSPSRFLTEIDSQYVEYEQDDDQGGLRSLSHGAFGRDHSGEGYRGGAGSQYGSQRQASGQAKGKGASAIEELRNRFDYRFQKQRSEERQMPNPKIVEPLRRSTEGMRRVVTTPVNDAAHAGPCPYAIGDKVEHPKFGVGTINRIESLTTDHKLVVDFGQYGEKTLLSKFAKLQKL